MSFPKCFSKALLNLHEVRPQKYKRSVMDLKIFVKYNCKYLKTHLNTKIEYLAITKMDLAYFQNQRSVINMIA